MILVFRVFISTLNRWVVGGGRLKKFTGMLWTSRNQVLWLNVWRLKFCLNDVVLSFSWDGNIFESVIFYRIWIWMYLVNSSICLRVSQNSSSVCRCISFGDLTLYMVSRRLEALFTKGWKNCRLVDLVLSLLPYIFWHAWSLFLFEPIGPWIKIWEFFGWHERPINKFLEAKQSQTFSCFSILS